ncbi:MAG: sensor histidine kinase [Myxococcaceae bacterium]|nr:MAG: sensor histidine kinase [Myxococcaceae bacterium]
MSGSMIAFEQPEIFEQQLAELSATFVSLPAEEVDQQIDWGLQLLLETLGMDLSSVAELSPDGQRFEVTHTQVRPGRAPLVSGNLAELLPWYTEMISRGQVLRFDRLPEELPAEAVAEREYVSRIGLRSQLTIPFQVAGRVIGAIGVASFERTVDWSPRLIRSIRLVGEVFANALARKHAAHEQLHLREQLVHSARVNTMGEVVATIAHEVNQPLFAIVSNARAAGTMLSRGEPDLAEIGAALDDIVQDANRASAIIARVRSFLQRKPTEHLPVDLNAVVLTVQSFLGPELVRRRVKLELELAAPLPWLLGDPVQLQQVLVNLLLNGMDAMESVPPETRRLRVLTRVASDGRILLEVLDAGSGLDPATREHLFEPFFTTKPSGLGMGLAICRSIVEAHAGRIQALERPGRGTTVQISLPAQGA